MVAILNGGEGMPAYAGALSPEEVNALVAFLEAPKRQTGEAQPAEDAETGAATEP